MLMGLEVCNSFPPPQLEFCLDKTAVCVRLVILHASMPKRPVTAHVDARVQCT